MSGELEFTVLPTPTHGLAYLVFAILQRDSPLARVATTPSVMTDVWAFTIARGFVS